MNRPKKILYVIDIFTILVHIVYSLYLLRVIFILYRETVDKLMAGIIIPVVTIIIISLFANSAYTISKGLYDRTLQKSAVILYVIFVASSDILIYSSFSTFHNLGKLIFIVINLLAVIHIRKYIFRQKNKKRIAPKLLKAE